MSKKNKGRPGFNSQGIKSLDHIKGPPRGIVLEMPPELGSCTHPDNKVIVFQEICLKCLKCGKVLKEL